MPIPMRSVPCQRVLIAYSERSMRATAGGGGAEGLRGSIFGELSRVMGQIAHRGGSSRTVRRFLSLADDAYPRVKPQSARRNTIFRRPSIKIHSQSAAGNFKVVNSHPHCSYVVSRLYYIWGIIMTKTATRDSVPNVGKHQRL